jgi:hypothetical protein
MVLSLTLAAATLALHIKCGVFELDLKSGVELRT